MIFQDRYKAHLNKLYNKKKVSNLLKDDAYKYRSTIDDMISNEIAKMAFEIELTGDKVNHKR